MLPYLLDSFDKEDKFGFTTLTLCAGDPSKSGGRGSVPSVNEFLGLVRKKYFRLGVRGREIYYPAGGAYPGQRGLYHPGEPAPGAGGILMEQRETRRALERLVQQGVVMGVDTGRRTARVKFPATGITSGWLHVLQHPGAGVGVEPAEGHSHKASLGLWMPKVNDAYSCAGARGSYEYFAKLASTEIGDVIANSPTPGVVKLYVLMEDGALATEEIKAAVLEKCSADEVRPLADQVFVEDAEPVDYTIDFTYYTQPGTGKSATEIREAVGRAVEEYAAWQSGKLGRDINPSALAFRYGRAALVGPRRGVFVLSEHGQI